MRKLFFAAVGIIGFIAVLMGLCNMTFVQPDDPTKAMTYAGAGLLALILGALFGGLPGTIGDRQDPAVVAHLNNLSNPFGGRLDVNRGEHLIRAGEIWRARGSHRMTGPDYTVKYKNVDWEVENVASFLKAKDSRGIQVIEVDDVRDAGVFIDGERIL